MRTIHYFVMPLLGAVYASGWWAWAIFDGPKGLLVPLIVIGILYFVAMLLMIGSEIAKGEGI